VSRLRFSLNIALLSLAACRGDSVAPLPLAVAAIGAIPATVAGAATGDSIRVRVAEVGGGPKSGVRVSFAVTAGGGSVSPAIATTDADGRAAAKFTTGTTVGVNTVTATVAGVAPATLTVTTIAGPATTLSLRERIVLIDAGQRFTPTFTATDANGNVVTASQLIYEPRAPFVVSIATDGSVTGSTGSSQAIVAVSSGTVRDSVLVVVATPNGPVLQTDLTRLDIARDTTFTVPVIFDMRTAPERLGATTVVVRWDPVQLQLLSQAEGATAGVVVNANEVAQGTLTLALASAAGLSGRLELRRLTFKATATAGRTGTLRLSTSDVFAAGTFASLLPKTTAITYPLSIR
jgi:hypothetical protein